MPENPQTSHSIRVEEHSGDGLVLAITGRLDADSVGPLWTEASLLLKSRTPAQLIIDASGVTFCDGAGLGLLLELRARQHRAGAECRIEGLPEDAAALLAAFDVETFAAKVEIENQKQGMPEEIGRQAVGIIEDMRDLITFVGQLTSDLVRASLSPRSVRWSDAWRVAETAGVNAMPVVVLIGFLLGLILAFQSATFMAMYGAEIYVANLISVSMLRELGPLMTAIVLAGRSGSAFAAELGTMKVNEEIDALNTMGLDPVRFLIVPRTIAAVAITPLLTLFCNFAGLVGGAVVMLTLDYPLRTYITQIQSACDLGDLLGGLGKSLVLGLLVAGIGCLRGLQTRSGASAVGDSATRAVVSGIVLIAIADSLFAVAFYYLGI